MSEPTCLECSVTLTPDNISASHNEQCSTCCDSLCTPISRANELTENERLAQALRKKFTYFAFMCSCKGTHEDCSNVINNPTYRAEMNMLNKIAEWLEQQ